MNLKLKYKEGQKKNVTIKLDPTRLIGKKTKLVMFNVRYFLSPSIFLLPLWRKALMIGCEFGLVARNALIVSGEEMNFFKCYDCTN